MTTKTDPRFELTGINHWRLWLSMEKAVEFYEDVLGFALIKAV